MRRSRRKGHGAVADGSNFNREEAGFAPGTDIRIKGEGTGFVDEIGAVGYDTLLLEYPVIRPLKCRRNG